MLHLFVVNPAAGRRDATPAIAQALSQMAGRDVRVYRTTGPGDATRYLKSFLARDAAPVRVYACGGDGTLNEVVNGAAGFSHASVGCYPCGSGNDFVKYYGGASAFLDLEALMDGEDTPVDLIQANDRYALNACHFGFDTAVAGSISKFKALPLMNGRRAYLAAVAKALLFSMRSRCALTCDGRPFHAGDFLLCTICNGSHVGGAYRCAPRSLNDDGLLEVCLVDPVSRLKFLRLMGVYRQGAHLDDPRFAGSIRYCRARTLRLSAAPGFKLSLDGELAAGTDFTIQALPRALRFILPKALCAASRGVA